MAPARSLALALLCVPLAAQEPAPGPGGDGTVWSTSEATALTHMRRLIEVANSDRRLPIRLPPGGMRAAGFRIACFARDEHSECVETRSGTTADGLFLLAWPEQPGGDTRRGILVHADGTTLCCELDNREGHALEPALVIGRGSAGKFDDVLRQPGTSATGHFWLWLQQVSKTVAIELVDEDGAPRAGFHVAFVAPDGDLTRGVARLPEGPWPVGAGATDARGRSRLQGPRADGLAAVVTTPDGTVQVGTGLVCEVTDVGLRMTLTGDAIRTAATLHNEAAAIATLKNISSAQAQCQASCAIDADGDGVGEYGFFAELAGVVTVRGSDTHRIAPPVLSRAFVRVTRSRVQRSGYLFQLFLPDAAGNGVAEAPDGGSRDGDGKDLGVAADRAEVSWCAYAWPASPDSGRRAFFVNQWGDVLAAANAGPRYVGHDEAPAATAAFAAPTTGLLDAVAVDKPGGDGQRWVVVR